ncbi:MAG: hypothetical protein JEZ08_06070 [Clostridiales bacterium]|nr:hypothetical protein [Clostridiales bacterium]
MNKKIEESINNFFESVMVLQNEHVIQTKDYANDIYKVIAKEKFGYESTPVTSNNCPNKQPCKLNRDIIHEKVIIVLGPVSNLKHEVNNKEILFYEVTIEEIERSATVNGKDFILMKDFFVDRKPNNIYKLD